MEPLVNNVGITRTEHIDFLESTVRLKLWFVWWHLHKNPQDSFRQTLNQRVDIWRKTSLNPAHLDGPWGLEKCPVWPTIVARLEQLHGETKNDANATAFERKGLEILHELLMNRVDRDMEDIRNKVGLENYQCGSLRHNLKPVQDNPQRILFHIANDCYPESPFADSGYFPQCFIKLLDACENLYGATEIGTGTWLNSYPKWLRVIRE